MNKPCFLKLCSLFATLAAVFSLALPGLSVQAKQTEDYNELELSALLNFYQFDILLEDEETKIKNHEYAELDLDLTKPWEYPGITWSSTLPYSVLSVDLTECPKLSGKLDLSSMTNLQSVDVSGTEIDWLVLGEHPKLTDIRASDSSLLTLDLSGCGSVENVICNNSALQSIVLPEHTLKTLSCDNNYLNFSTLPPTDCAESYDYIPQKDAFFIAQSQVGTIELGSKVKMDYAGADEISWFYADGRPVNSTLVKEHTYTFEGLELDDRLYAVMTSKKFPELTLKTSEITIIQNTSGVWFMFLGAVLIFFVIFFALRYTIAKRQGVELTTDQFTDRISDFFGSRIRKLTGRISKK